MKLARTNAIIPLPTDAGAFGVLLEAVSYPEKASVSVAAGGFAGTVRVKLVQAADPGTFLQLVNSADGCAFGPDSGAGACVIMAQSLEAGAVGELVEAVLFKPIDKAA